VKHTRWLVLFAFPIFIAPMPALSTPGALDKNGCHYDRTNGSYHCHKDVPPNSDMHAPVKKSRDNICHDQRSPNYRSLRYFVSYQSMDECLVSGGVEYRHH
jgi:hypothetical protein